MWKSSYKVCVKFVFNFNGPTNKHIRNIKPNASIRVAFTYWETMQIRISSCVVIRNLIIQGKEISKVIQEKTMFELVIEFYSTENQRYFLKRVSRVI